MSLSKEKISKWIESNISNDSYKHEIICSEVTVHAFKQIDNKLEVEYSFWDDLHFDASNQENFLFDISIGENYGVNFPKNFDYVLCKDIYNWPNASDCEQLKSNLINIDEKITDIKKFSWDDSETQKFIDIYFNAIDKVSMTEMLINEYEAKKSMPSFIPKCLLPFFQKMVC
jgi:hypothetical protein